MIALNRNRAIALVLFATLASCTETASTGPVGPGSRSVPAIEAVGLFNNICVNKGPDFSNSEEALDGFSGYQQAATGTYFSKRNNLSFKIIRGNGPETCSMVVAMVADGSDYRSMLSQVAGLHPDQTISVIQVAGGYFRFATEAK